MESLQKYISLVNISFQSLSEYRLDFFLGLLGRFATFLVIYLFWYFLARSGVSISPYTVETLGLYYLLIYLIGAIIYFDANTLAWEIREGYTSIALVKPINYIAYFFAASSAQRMINVFLGLIVLPIFFAIVSIPSPSVLNILLFILSVTLAIIGNYLLYFNIGLLEIWTQQTHGFSALISIGSGLVSGSMIPIALMPEYLIRITLFLPFRYFIYLPVQILLNKADPGEAIIGIVIEIVWIMIFYVGYKVIWTAGSKRLESVGI